LLDAALILFPPHRCHYADDAAFDAAYAIIFAIFDAAIAAALFATPIFISPIVYAFRCAD